MPPTKGRYSCAASLCTMPDHVLGTPLLPGILPSHVRRREVPELYPGSRPLRFGFEGLSLLARQVFRVTRPLDIPHLNRASLSTAQPRAPSLPDSYCSTHSAGAVLLYTINARCCGAQSHRRPVNSSKMRVTQQTWFMLISLRQLRPRNVDCCSSVVKPFRPVAVSVASRPHGSEPLPGNCRSNTPCLCGSCSVEDGRPCAWTPPRVRELRARTSLCV